MLILLRQAQFGLGEQLRERLVRVMAPPPSPAIPTPVLLMTVLSERRRRAEQAYTPVAHQTAYFPPTAAYSPAAHTPTDSGPVTPPSGFAPPA